MHADQYTISLPGSSSESPELASLMVDATFAVEIAYSIFLKSYSSRIYSSQSERENDFSFQVLFVPGTSPFRRILPCT